VSKRAWEGQPVFWQTLTASRHASHNTGAAQPGALLCASVRATTSLQTDMVGWAIASRAAYGGAGRGSPPLGRASTYPRISHSWLPHSAVPFCGKNTLTFSCDGNMAHCGRLPALQPYMHENLRNWSWYAHGTTCSGSLCHSTQDPSSWQQAWWSMPRPVQALLSSCAFLTASETCCELLLISYSREPDRPTIQTFASWHWRRTLRRDLLCARLRQTRVLKTTASYPGAPNIWFGRTSIALRRALCPLNTVLTAGGEWHHNADLGHWRRDV